MLSMLQTAKLASLRTNKAARVPSEREPRSWFCDTNVSGENTAADQLSPPCFCQSDAIETEHSFLGGSIWQNLLFNKMFR
jgi:hypothetical protein